MEEAALMLLIYTKELAIEVKVVLVRMNTDRYSFRFATLQVDVVIDEVLCEYAAFSQEVGISFQEHQKLRLTYQERCEFLLSLHRTFHRCFVSKGP